MSIYIIKYTDISYNLYTYVYIYIYRCSLFGISFMSSLLICMFDPFFTWFIPFILHLLMTDATCTYTRLSRYICVYVYIQDILNSFKCTCTVCIKHQNSR